MHATIIWPKWNLIEVINWRDYHSCMSTRRTGLSVRVEMLVWLDQKFSDVWLQFVQLVMAVWHSSLNYYKPIDWLGEFPSLTYLTVRFIIVSLQFHQSLCVWIHHNGIMNVILKPEATSTKLPWNAPLNNCMMGKYNNSGSYQISYDVTSYNVLERERKGGAREVGGGFTQTVEQHDYVWARL